MGVAVISNSNNTHYLDIDGSYVSQSIAGNYSTVYYRVLVTKSGSSGYFSGASSRNNGNCYAEGVAHLWSWGNGSFDFRNGSSGGSFTMAEGYVNIPHAMDGTGAFNIYGNISIETPSDYGTASTGSGWKSLPRIPRGPRVKHGGTYRNTILYVKHSGTYRIAIPYVKHAGAYKIGGG